MPNVKYAGTSDVKQGQKLVAEAKFWPHSRSWPRGQSDVEVLTSL